MAVSASNSSIFPLFSSLPPELRNQIWREAVRGKIGPALYFYSKGYWCPRRLSKFDEGYDPDDEEGNLYFKFRYDFLDHPQLEVPLFFVNREARGIALAWIREQGIKIRFYENRQYPIFVRPFDPMHDARYIARDKWDELLCEPHDRGFQPDHFEKLLNIESAFLCLKRLWEFKQPGRQELLLSKITTLSDLFQYFFKLKVLIHYRRRAAGCTSPRTMI